MAYCFWSGLRAATDTRHSRPSLTTNTHDRHDESSLNLPEGEVHRIGVYPPNTRPLRRYTKVSVAAFPSHRWWKAAEEKPSRVAEYSAATPVVRTAAAEEHSTDSAHDLRVGRSNELGDTWRGGC